jgi:elongator complex protein 1
LGKAAATAVNPAATAASLSSPDDDANPRISWRGDGAYFVVSSFDSLPTKRRVLRTYSQACELLATSESIPGIEHPLAFRPSGSLIASSQRFGAEGEGLGLGREGRHDVVFFERNGLRRGEFGLRVPTQTIPTVGKRWTYRVKELRWSSDSNIIAVWIEDDSGDAGKT